MGMGAGTLTLGACGLIPSASSDPITAPVISTSFPPAPDLPTLAVDLTAGKATLPIFSGPETSIWRYQASAKEGSGESIQTLRGSYLGPIFRVRQGQRVQVRLKNELPDPTIIHWHGLRIPEDMDGHPRSAIAPGKSYEYDFQVINRAGTYWFHPHPHELTGPQVNYGLAGLFIVSDDEEAALGLPSGEYDIPLVIQDRTFDSQNQMVYLANGMMDQMIGFLGDTFLVNGAPKASMEVKASVYRLRLLNGSNSRIYKLAWQDGAPLTVIATDGGLLEKPVTRDYIAKIDDMGGALQAIEKGYMQNEIQNAAYAAQQAVERKEQIVVGVNAFEVKEERSLERLEVDPAIEAAQKAKLKELRETRDQRLVEQLLAKLKSAASGTGNLMPLFVECVENDITLGEICNTLRVVWGEYVAEGF